MHRAQYRATPASYMLLPHNMRRPVGKRMLYMVLCDGKHTCSMCTGQQTTNLFSPTAVNILLCILCQAAAVPTRHSAHTAAVNKCATATICHHASLADRETHATRRQPPAPTLHGRANHPQPVAGRHPQIWPMQPVSSARQPSALNNKTKAPTLKGLPGQSTPAQD